MKQVTIEYYGAKVEVREDGRIKNNCRYRTHRINADGYPVVTITTPYGSRSVGVHILMAMAFVPNDDPINKTEVNHKDFDRTNWKIENLEWISHGDNVRYSADAGRYKGKCGGNNPNYGNNTLHKKYTQNKELSKEKQSRPRSKNGRATKCYIKRIDLTFFAPIHFDCQRDAVDWLINMEYIPSHNKEYLIKKLKGQDGYCGWKLTQF